MTINIDQDNYITQTGELAGVRLSILNQNLMPFPADDGVTVSPGYATTIKFTQAGYSICCYLQSISHNISGSCII